MIDDEGARVRRSEDGEDDVAEDAERSQRRRITSGTRLLAKDATTARYATAAPPVDWRTGEIASPACGAAGDPSPRIEPPTLLTLVAITPEARRSDPPPPPRFAGTAREEPTSGRQRAVLRAVELASEIEPATSSRVTEMTLTTVVAKLPPPPPAPRPLAPRVVLCLAALALLVLLLGAAVAMGHG